MMFPIYLFALVDSGGLTFVAAYELLALSDLDSGHTNPQQCCSSLNELVVPEILAFSLLVLVHLVTMNWILVATNIPMLMFIAYKYYSVPRGNIGIFDPAEIYNKDKMRGFIREYVVKIIFHLAHFVAYMYLALLSIITASTAYN